LHFLPFYSIHIEFSLGDFSRYEQDVGDTASLVSSAVLSVDVRLTSSRAEM